MHRQWWTGDVGLQGFQSESLGKTISIKRLHGISLFILSSCSWCGVGGCGESLDKATSVEVRKGIVQGFWMVDLGWSGSLVSG